MLVKAGAAHTPSGDKFMRQRPAGMRAQRNSCYKVKRVSF